MGNEFDNLDELDDVLEQGDYYEDDGFSVDMEDTPNREQINSLKEPEVPSFVVKILKWIVDKIFAIIIILIVLAFVFLGYKVLSYMGEVEADIGGINSAVEMLEK
jgi:hypothetical protein